VHDMLRNGRFYKMLTVLGENTQEALCAAVKSNMKSAAMVDTCYPFLRQCEKLEHIHCDSGWEFIAASLQYWLRNYEWVPPHRAVN